MAKEMVDGAWRKDSVPSPFPLLIKETQELSEEETNPDEQSIGHLSANVWINILRLLIDLLR